MEACVPGPRLVVPEALEIYRQSREKAALCVSPVTVWPSGGRGRAPEPLIFNSTMGSGEAQALSCWIIARGISECVNECVKRASNIGRRDARYKRSDRSVRCGSVVKEPN